MRLTPYNLCLWFIGFFVASGLFVGVLISSLVDSPVVRYNLVGPATLQNTSTTYLTNPPTTTVSVTTTTTTSPPTTTTVQTTTPVPAVQITCPSNVTIILGSSLSPTFTGGSAVATGGCSAPPVQYTDTVVNTTLSKKRSPSFSSAHLQVEADLNFNSDAANYGDSFVQNGVSDLFVLSARHTTINKTAIFTLTDKTLGTVVASDIVFTEGN